jgi:phage-related protein
MKPLLFVGSAGDDLREFPRDVRRDAGFALDRAQRGMIAPNVKALSGFGSADVLEIVLPHEGDAFRAIYTVRFRAAIYVLHCFQKKSKMGAKTPKRDIELIKKRLSQATAAYKVMFGGS